MSAPVIVNPKTSKASKPQVARKVPSHPTYSAMVRKSILELKEKTGSSKSAILKYMMTHYSLGENVTKVNNQLRMALRKGVAKGELKQVKGSGASGSFTLVEKKASMHGKTSAEKRRAKGPKSPKKIISKMSKAEKKSGTPKKTKTPKAKSATRKPMVKTTRPKSAKSKMFKTNTTKKVTV